MTWWNKRRIDKDAVESSQRQAEEAIRASEQNLAHVESQDKVVKHAMKSLGKLNRANGFGAKMELAYRGKA